MRKQKWLLASSMLALFGSAALSQETTTYSYDVLGRLTGSSITGGPNNTRKTGACFDPAGNRARYEVATTAPGPCPTPTPTPVPTPSP